MIIACKFPAPDTDLAYKRIHIFEQLLVTYSAARSNVLMLSVQDKRINYRWQWDINLSIHI